MNLLSAPEAYLVAVQHHQQGRLREAEALLKHCLQGMPQNADAWHRLGMIALVTGRPVEACPALQRAVELMPHEASCRSNLGVALYSIGRDEEARASFTAAVERAPTIAHFHRNLGDVLFRLGRVDEAIASYQSAIGLNAQDAAAHNNLGNVFLKQRRLEEAQVCYARAVALEPGLLQAVSNLGDIRTKLGDPDEGIAWARRSVEIDPRFGGGYLNIGVGYWQKGDTAEAEANLRHAVTLEPGNANAHLSLGINLLLQGQFEEGWREYEWRWRSPDRPLRQFSIPRWGGTPVPGQRLLVYSDQGLGDVIHFLRYLPMVQERSAAAVTLECQAAVLPLVQQVCSAMGKGQSDAELSAQFDQQVPLMSLPFTLQQFESVTMSAPYLQASEAGRAAWRTRLGTKAGLRVGLSWAGNPDHEDDRRRSMKPDLLLPLTRVEGVQLYSLQLGGLPPVLRDAGVLDVSTAIKTMADTADLLAQIDLLVSVDTAPVHLAGAMGRPVWTLLAFVPDWRWALRGESTPLYPSMRLFRQPSAGDWLSVVAQVAKELAAHAEGLRAGKSA